MIMGHLVKYICLHLENKIFKLWHSCSATVLHYDAILSNIIPLSKDFDIALGHTTISIIFG